MKGLLIKDFKLMKNQKNFLLLLVLIAALFVFVKDISFVITYMTFMGTLFSMSSISYDEFDNGNAFLFSLPVTRRGYVIEKYGFGLILGGGAWLIGTILAVVIGRIQHTDSITETIMTALIILPLMWIALSAVLPFQLKYGGEKGRIVMIGVFGIFFAIGAAVMKVAKILNIDLIYVMDHLPEIHMSVLTMSSIGVAAVVLLVSCKISISIVNKKEF
ncbi:MAG: ABC-2 transporter permease [Lachnospiraceae bacterium]|nr:ABC-2 transporter permease [Lachnospiraceae bacterium]